MTFVYEYTATEQDHLGPTYLTGTGLKVGGDSGYNWIVMFTHYPELANFTNGMTGVRSQGQTVTGIKVEEGQPDVSVNLRSSGTQESGVDDRINCLA